MPPRSKHPGGKKSVGKYNASNAVGGQAQVGKSEIVQSKKRVNISQEIEAQVKSLLASLKVVLCLVVQ